MFCHAFFQNIYNASIVNYFNAARKYEWSCW